MSKRQLNHVGLVILAIGGGFIAIMAVKDQLIRQFPFLPDSFFRVSLVMGFVLTIVGILLFIIPIHWAVDSWRWMFGRSILMAHAARRDDLEHIHAYGVEEFGEVSPLDTMREWHKINRNMFHLVKRVRRGKLVTRLTIVGYYSVIPLKQTAIPFLDADNFDGTKITPNLIVKERNGRRQETAACIYIGSIAARGTPYARGRVVGELHGRIRVEQERGIRLVYSRPVTEKGLKMLTDNGFQPVRPNYQEPLKHIYKLNL
ncbi:MAG TPA: hypothetical protein VE863_08420 [Pyrinomonadaceae bacterium]|jgi:uncharacterized protein YjeT (DUF2065 family)|nr:hypothetical protein [Pyrinomonadaceae bacterium]